MVAYPTSPRTGITRQHQAGLLTYGSLYSPGLPFSTVRKSGSFGFRPRSQRRDRSRFLRDSLLNSKVPDAKNFQHFFYSIPEWGSNQIFFGSFTCFDTGRLKGGFPPRESAPGGLDSVVIDAPMKIIDLTVVQPRPTGYFLLVTNNVLCIEIGTGEGG